MVDLNVRSSAVLDIDSGLHQLVCTTTRARAYPSADPTAALRQRESIHLRTE
jgi:hypothetical protein